jgi:hypothetical protein
MKGAALKIFIILAFTMLSACGLFHKKAPPPPIPPELIVTGAPKGSIVFIDGAQQGHLTEANGQPQVLIVASGAHTVEVRIGDSVVYREDTYVKSGEKRVVAVLSGSNRE